MKGNRRPIIYASLSLSKETLCCYREIRLSRSLGIYKKFNEYVVSMNFVVETDHKPLQSLFNIHTYIPIGKTEPISSLFMTCFSVTSAEWFPGPWDWRYLTASILVTLALPSNKLEPERQYGGQDSLRRLKTWWQIVSRALNIALSPKNHSYRPPSLHVHGRS